MSAPRTMSRRSFATSLAALAGTVSLATVSTGSLTAAGFPLTHDDRYANPLDSATPVEIQAGHGRLVLSLLRMPEGLAAEPHPQGAEFLEADEFMEVIFSDNTSQLLTSFSKDERGAYIIDAPEGTIWFTNLGYLGVGPSITDGLVQDFAVAWHIPAGQQIAGEVVYGYDPNAQTPVPTETSGTPFMLISPYMVHGPHLPALRGEESPLSEGLPVGKGVLRLMLCVMDEKVFPDLEAPYHLVGAEGNEVVVLPDSTEKALGSFERDDEGAFIIETDSDVVQLRNLDPIRTNVAVTNGQVDDAGDQKSIVSMELVSRRTVTGYIIYGWQVPGRG